MAACIVGSGVLVYGYLALIARELPTGEYADFSAFWSTALIIGFGAFLPVELELARTLPSQPDGARLPRGAVPVTAGLVGVAAVVTLAASPLISPAVGGPGVVVALLAICAVSGGQFLLRGLLLGTGRLRVHGTLLLVDASLRVAAAAGVGWLVSGAGPTSFAWTLAGAIALAHLPVLVVLGRRTGAFAPPRGGEPRGAFAAAVGPLLVGTLCAQVLLNITPVLVSALAGHGGGAAADQFTATFTLARLPLFVAVPLQSALVPTLTRMATGGQAAALRRLVTTLIAGTVGVAAFGGLLGFTVGRPLVSLLFGDRYELSAGATALLAVGSGLHLGLLVVSQAVLASGLHRHVALVWVTGLVTGGLVFGLVPDLVTRACLGFTLGSGAALATGAAVLLRQHRSAAGDQHPVPGHQEESRRA